jgi:hypothetical protein
VSLVGPETRTKRTLTQRSSEPTARLSCSAVVSWPNRGGDPTAVARTCWTRPPLVRLVAWSTTLPQAARARGIRMIVSPATVRRCCHGLAVAVRGRGGRAPGHQTAVTRAGRPGGWQRTWTPGARIHRRGQRGSGGATAIGSKLGRGRPPSGSVARGRYAVQGRKGAWLGTLPCRRAVATGRRPRPRATPTRRDGKHRAKAALPLRRRCLSCPAGASVAMPECSLGPLTINESYLGLRPSQG